jgi:hypothetical protein
VTENPALAAVVERAVRRRRHAARIADALDHVRELGAHLGEEIAVAVGVDAAASRARRSSSPRSSTPAASTP